MKEFNGSRVLVTGGNGFIGSHLTAKLVELEANVSIISRNPDTTKIEEFLDKVDFYKVDLAYDDSLSKIIKRIEPEIVFHLSADLDVRRDIKLLNYTIDNNLKGAMNLIISLEDLTKRYEVLVNTGTCEEYGNGDAPFKEDQVPRPVSPYSASKVAITSYCKMLYETQGLPIVTVRPFLTYGPKQTNANMFIPSLILSCLMGKKFKMTKGEQTRDFVYIDDVVEGYLKAALTKKAVGEIVNIGSGQEYRIIDVANRIVKLTNSGIELDTSLPCRPGETMHFFSCNKKAKTLLDWEPRTNLEEGLEKTIGWYSSKFKEGYLDKWTVKKT